MNQFFVNGRWVDAKTARKIRDAKKQPKIVKPKPQPQKNQETVVNLEGLKRPELIKLLKEKGIKFKATMKNVDIINLLK
jgi:hypothetical protein